jgi:hypothetical protein
VPLARLIASKRHSPEVERAAVEPSHDDTFLAGTQATSKS